VYNGGNCHHARPPGSTTAQVDIYETPKEEIVNVPAHVVIFNRNGATMISEKNIRLKQIRSRRWLYK